MGVRRSRLRLLAWVAGCLLAGCGGDGPSPTPSRGPDDGLPATCHPLRSAGVCASPFPASHYLDEDPTTATGYRVALGPEHFPTTGDGLTVDATTFAGRDGFSPSTHLLAVFDERIDGAPLPTLEDPTSSLSDASPTCIVDVDSGERVLHFAELDARVENADQRQALILRPVSRLRTGARYVAFIRRGLVTVGGEPLSRPVGWGDGPSTEVVEAIGRDGTPLEEVVLAWEFVTASRGNVAADLDRMAAHALTMLPDDGLGYTIEAVDEDYSSTTLRRVVGTFSVPRFVSHTDLDVAEIALLRDETGAPRADGTYEAPFTLLVPRRATSEAVRLLVYGHGFVNTAAGAFGDSDDERFPQRYGDSHGYAFIGTDWWGLSEHETGSGAIAAALKDINRLPWLATRLQQAVVANMVLARTAKAIAADPAVLGVATPGGPGTATILDDRVDYFGISLGGIMGAVLLAHSPDYGRAVLHVGAGSWSTLLQRSKLWGLFGLFVNAAFRTPFERLQLISGLQLAFDPVDGMSRGDELVDRGRVLLQMGLHDDAVSNVATAMLARTMGLSLLDDSPVAIPDIGAMPGPLESALTVWDTGQASPPSTNEANSAADPNDIHEKLREVPALQEQLDVFLRDGVVISTCEGPCDPD